MINELPSNYHKMSQLISTYYHENNSSTSSDPQIKADHYLNLIEQLICIIQAQNKEFATFEVDVILGDVNNSYAVDFISES